MQRSLILMNGTRGLRSVAVGMHGADELTHGPAMDVGLKLPPSNAGA